MLSLSQPLVRSLKAYLQCVSFLGLLNLWSVRFHILSTIFALVYEGHLAWVNADASSSLYSTILYRCNTNVVAPERTDTTCSTMERYERPHFHRKSIWQLLNSHCLSPTIINILSQIGSLFTYGLGHIKSDTLHSYQIIFMFCGLLTVLYSAFVLLLMPDSPMEAKCLSDREKFIAVQRLRANQMGIVSRQWRWDHVLETFYDLKTWGWFFLIIAIS